MVQGVGKITLYKQLGEKFHIGTRFELGLGRQRTDRWREQIGGEWHCGECKYKVSFGYNVQIYVIVAEMLLVCITYFYLSLETFSIFFFFLILGGL